LPHSLAYDAGCEQKIIELGVCAAEAPIGSE